MPNNYLSELYKHLIQVENKNVGLKVGGGGGGAQTYQRGGGHAPLPPPPRFLRQCNSNAYSSIFLVKIYIHFVLDKPNLGEWHRPLRYTSSIKLSYEVQTYVELYYYYLFIVYVLTFI